MMARAPRLVLLVAVSLGAPIRATAADAGAARPVVPAAAALTPAPASAKAKPGVSAAKPQKKPKAPKNPPVVLYTVNHKETFSLRLRDAQGKPVKGNQKRFDRLLRCHHTEAKHAMNPRLMR